MIRTIIDNLLCMGIAAAVISLLMLITGALSLGRFHARWHLAGWMIAMFTLLIPVYALIGIIQPGSVFPIPQVQAEKYYAEYTAFMGRSITDILNPGTDSQPDLEDLSTQMQMDSTFVQPNMTFAPTYTRSTATVNSHAENPIAEPPFLAAAVPAASLLPVRNVLFAVWVAVAFLIGTFKLFAYFSFKRKILKNSSPGNDRWDVALPSESLLKIQIREAHIPSPVVFGIFRPTIVIPADAKDISAVRYSLIHEFLHIEHKDLLIKTLAEIAAAVQWFNPFAWLIRNKVKSFCENACDEAVAVRLSEDSRKSYSNAFLDFMDYSQAPEPYLPATLMSFSGDAGNVKKRINRIMKYRKPNIFIRIFSICIIILITAAGTGTASSLSNYGNKMMAAAGDASFTASSVPLYTGEPTPSPVPLPPVHFDLTGEQGSVYGNPLTIEANDDYVMVLGGENSPLRMDGKFSLIDNYYYSDGYMNLLSMDTQYSTDGTSLAVILDRDSTKTGKLMYCDGKSVLEVANGVDSFQLSNDGSTIAYLTGTYEHGVGGSLYLFDCNSGKTRFISDGASRLFTLSPSGDAIAYCTFYEADNADALQAFFCVNNGEEQDIGKDCYCVALTDDGSTVYYVRKLEDGEEFYAMHNGKIRLLAHPYSADLNIPNPFAQYCLNNDCSQVVFGNGSEIYFSVDGGEPRFICKGFAATYIGVYDQSSGSAQGFNRYLTDEGHTNCATTFPGTKNLCNILFYISSAFGTLDPVFFDENMLVHTIDVPDNIWGISSMNHSFSYSDGNIHFLENYLVPDAEPVNTGRIAYMQSEDRTVYSLSYPDASSENSAVLELKVSQNGGEAVHISDVVLSFYLLEKDGPDILYYLAVPPEIDPASSGIQYTDYFPYAALYSLEDVPGAQPVLLASKVCRIVTGDYGVVYWKYAAADAAAPFYYWSDNDLVDVYYSRDGVDFTKIMQHSFFYSIGG